MLKVKALKSSQLGDDGSKMFYVASSFLLCVRVLEPRTVASKIEISNRVDLGVEKALEDFATYILKVVIKVVSSIAEIT